jgi:hypothetical protein
LKIGSTDILFQQFRPSWKKYHRKQWCCYTVLRLIQDRVYWLLMLVSSL